MPLYFAYGSNMSSARLRARIGSVRPLGAVHASDFRLAFNKPGGDGTGKANLVPSAGSRVWGVAWELSETGWDDLDRFEPGYARARFRLERVDGGAVEAVAYVFEPANGPPIPPHPDYVEHLVTGALEHALPEDYVAWIRSLSGRVAPGG